MIYNVNIKAQIESKLPKQKLESKLVIALYDVESQYSKIDGFDDDLEVTDYKITEAVPVCQNCYEELDVDGINSGKYLVCENCKFKELALK